MAPAGLEPGPSDFLARAHPILGPGGTGAHSQGCAGTGPRARMVGSAYRVRTEYAALGGLCLPSEVLFCVPGLGQATEETLRWGVLRAGGLKKWPLCLQHTQQESGSL